MKTSPKTSSFCANLEHHRRLQDLFPIGSKSLQWQSPCGRAQRPRCRQRSPVDCNPQRLAPTVTHGSAQLWRLTSARISNAPPSEHPLERDSHSHAVSLPVRADGATPFTGGPSANGAKSAAVPGEKDAAADGSITYNFPAGDQTMQVIRHADHRFAGPLSWRHEVWPDVARPRHLAAPEPSVSRYGYPAALSRLCTCGRARLQTVDSWARMAAGKSGRFLGVYQVQAVWFYSLTADAGGDRLDAALILA